MKKHLIIFSVLLVIVIGSVVWLHATPPAAPAAPAPTPPAPIIGTTTAAPTIIAVNTPTTVTVTSVITDPSLITTDINLLRINPTGNPTIMGQLRDDGTNGDAVAGDKIFTTRVTFNEPNTGQIRLQVSAAFRGQLKRTMSSVIGIDVWSVLSGSSQETFLSLAYPHGWIPTESTPDRVILLNDAPNGYRIEALSRPKQASSSLDNWVLREWLSDSLSPDLASSPLTRISSGQGELFHVTVASGKPALILLTRSLGLQLTAFIADDHDNKVLIVKFKGENIDQGENMEASLNTILNIVRMSHLQ